MELLRALGALAEPPGPEQVRFGEMLGCPGAPDAAAYTDLFLFQLYPYASVYLGPEGMMGGEALDRIAGFWRALQWAPPPEPDHLAALLALGAAMHECEAEETGSARCLLWRQARKALLWEHLACWLFPYLAKLDEIAPPFYRAWAEILREAMRGEICELGPADSLPRHLRDVDQLPDPRDDGVDAFLAGLLAPARSGMILTRADLASAGADLDLGLRMGERRLMLKSLIAQEPGRVIAWLKAEALWWARWHDEQQALLGDIAVFWAARATAAAALLAALEKERAGV